MSENSVIPPEEKGPGRPPGAKNKESLILRKDKKKIKALYVSGHLPEEIAKMGPIHDVKLIKAMAKKGHWDDLKAKAMDMSSNAMLDNLLKTQMETFDGLQVIKDKSLGRIKKVDGEAGGAGAITVKYSEAVNAYIASVELERKWKTDTLHLKFVMEIAEVLKKEVQDKVLLDHIVQELMKVYGGYSHQTFPELKAGNPNG